MSKRFYPSGTAGSPPGVLPAQRNPSPEAHSAGKVFPVSAAHVPILRTYPTEKNTSNHHVPEAHFKRKMYGEGQPGGDQRICAIKT
jgi:hypothetical protein